MVGIKLSGGDKNLNAWGNMDHDRVSRINGREWAWWTNEPEMPDDDVEDNDVSVMCWWHGSDLEMMWLWLGYGMMVTSTRH